MIDICFSRLTAGCRAVPLAQACVPEWREPASGARYARLFREAGTHWRAVPMERARVAVFSDWYGGGAAAEAFGNEARGAGVPCLFFDPSEECAAHGPAYGTVYRCALHRSWRTPAERAMPPAHEGVLGSNGRAGFTAKPVVGFCGRVPRGWRSLLGVLRGRRERRDARRLRWRALRALAGSPLVATRFLIRRRARGEGWMTWARRELGAGCGYVLCGRGAGNFSRRFYQALSRGRVPLLIDTDCCLPLSDRIDWRKHCVIVGADAVEDAPAMLAAFHGSMDAERFGALQAANARLWEEYLNPLSFHRLVVEGAVERRGAVGVFG